MAGSYYEVKPDTTYPVRYGEKHARWEGVLNMLYTKIDGYPAGGLEWIEPDKYFKNITQAWFENVQGFTLYYNRTDRKILVFIMAESEAINFDIKDGTDPLSFRWVLEGTQI